MVQPLFTDTEKLSLVLGLGQRRPSECWPLIFLGPSLAFLSQLTELEGDPIASLPGLGGWWTPKASFLIRLLSVRPPLQDDLSAKREKKQCMSWFSGCYRLNF